MYLYWKLHWKILPNIFRISTCLNESKRYKIVIQEKLDNIFEDQKDIGINSELEKEIKKRPKSSATTFMFYSNKNKNIDKDIVRYLPKVRYVPQ